MGSIIFPLASASRFTLALDSMLFIYLLDTTNPDFYQITKNLFHQLESQKIASVTSVISLLETLSSPSLEKNPEKIEEYNQFFQKMIGLTVLPVVWEISLQAAGLRRKYHSLKT